MSDIIIWCADIGSIKNKRFGWCRGTIIEDKLEVITGTEIQDFAEGIAKDISNGYKVALGFECPLFLPIPEDPLYLTSARKGEGDRLGVQGQDVER